MLTDTLREALAQAQQQVNALVLGKPHQVRCPDWARPRWRMRWPRAWA
jgi:hypothetical protein